jgi:ABC-type molybdate transport system substrate-binding protein
MITTSYESFSSRRLRHMRRGRKISRTGLRLFRSGRRARGLEHIYTDGSAPEVLRGVGHDRPHVLAESGAELVGPFPRDLQNYIVYSAGVSAAAQDAGAAKAFINFLAQPGSMSVMKSNGLEPVAPR